MLPERCVTICAAGEWYAKRRDVVHGERDQRASQKWRRIGPRAIGDLLAHKEEQDQKPKINDDTFETMYVFVVEIADAQVVLQHLERDRDASRVCDQRR